MKLSLNKLLLIYILPFSLVINAISIEFLTGYDDRNFFKLLSLMLLFFVFLASKRFNKKFIYLFSFSAFFYFSLFLSDFIFNLQDSYKPLARLIASMMFLSVLFSISIVDLACILRFYSKLLLLVALIGLLFLIYPPYIAEKIPVIDVYSTKSIFFEQNIYGMAIYFVFLYLFTIKGNFVNLSISLLAVFSSYYRTVIGLTLFRLIFTRFFLVLFVLFFVFITYFYNEISLALKLEQVSSLTGRDVLWIIGLTGFSESPLIGNGESSIPYYSNLVLNRNPAYTTYHNVIVDILFSGGFISFFLYLIIVLFVYSKISTKDWFLLSLFLVPSLFNTYYLFSFNVLSGFISLWVVYKIKINCVV